MKKLIGLLAFVPFLAGAQIITTFAGNGAAGYTGDGMPATASGLLSPYGVGLDSIGNFFIGDAGDNRIRMIDLSGIITTIAGNGTAGYSGDGGPATAASMNMPIGMAVSLQGNIYMADYNNHRIRMIRAESGGDIITIAGNGVPGFTGDGGPATAAEIYHPQGIYLDVYGNVYFGDEYNHRVRKIDVLGNISTVAGNGTAGYSGDGMAATASALNYPCGVAVDALGNVFINDYFNHRIRKVNSSGIINTVAGNGTMGYSGDGGAATAAELKYPKDVTLDALGNLYITDADNFRVRKVDLSGTITTIAGTGVMGFSGDGGPATAAELNEPQGIFVDRFNKIYFGDCLNNRIRVITPTPTNIGGDFSINLSIYPNPTIDNITFYLSGISNGKIQLINELGQVVIATEITAQYLRMSLSKLPAGLYITRIQSSDQVVYRTIMKK